ncbi:NAD(P)-binding protein [Eremomyces bilateralis CBS 781.70]|uniref:NAD(P)-binding protein n=1 Tax=Eremomyces bilateralis CBS 781.70 TaxID=1392243 RepID=A0A6G1G8N5_9PEZI|nr:NAD(P)-binding protein [Eremomyces bilateralis CBS 781.70]KAF1814404.1 NAD(P)-binding protein [Eremomyces bilateralis CBS 781.70]
MDSKPGYIRTSSTNLLSSNDMMSRPLEGQLGIVTGASRGIGAAISANLAAKGCNLVLNFTSDASALRTGDLAKRLSDEHGIQALPVQADMGSVGGPKHIVSIAKNHFSHPKTGKFTIHVIVNNAGVSKNLSIEECTAEDFAWQYSVNVQGPLLLIQAALPYLPTDRSGRIINVSSVSSTLGYIGQSVYGGTKAALESMTRTWSRELAERATVNAINPGPVATEMYGSTSKDFQARNRPFIENAPLARAREGIDDPETVQRATQDGGRAAYDWEIAGVVGMLCSKESAWCTGSVICANGGMKFGF